MDSFRGDGHHSFKDKFIKWSALGRVSIQKKKKLETARIASLRIINHPPSVCCVQCHFVTPVQPFP